MTSTSPTPHTQKKCNTNYMTNTNWRHRLSKYVLPLPIFHVGWLKPGPGMLIGTWSQLMDQELWNASCYQYLNQIVKGPVMVRFKLRLKSNIFIVSNTEHSRTLILNLNDTTDRIHFLRLWTMQQLNLSSFFLIWEYSKWHLLLCHSTWEKMGSWLPCTVLH